MKKSILATSISILLVSGYTNAATIKVNSTPQDDGNGNSTFTIQDIQIADTDLGAWIDTAYYNAENAIDAAATADAKATQALIDADTKASAALVAANDYTDAQLSQAALDQNWYTDHRIGASEDWLKDVMNEKDEIKRWIRKFEQHL